VDAAVRADWWVYMAWRATLKCGCTKAKKATLEKVMGVQRPGGLPRVVRVGVRVDLWGVYRNQAQTLLATPERNALALSLATLSCLLLVFVISLSWCLYCRAGFDVC